MTNPETSNDASPPSVSENKTRLPAKGIWRFVRDKRVIAFLVIAIGVFMLSTCGKISWKEEVQLQSGEVIVVQRTAKTKSYGEIGGPGGWENEGMTVKIISDNVKDAPPVWNFPLDPIIFDRDSETGKWFLLATIDSCANWRALGKPPLPYVEYQLINDKWVLQALSKKYIGRKANMLTSISSKGEPDHTLASKTKKMSNVKIPSDYKEIVNTWSSNC